MYSRRILFYTVRLIPFEIRIKIITGPTCNCIKDANKSLWENILKLVRCNSREQAEDPVQLQALVLALLTRHVLQMNGQAA
jgi:hypothetical protein